MYLFQIPMPPTANNLYSTNWRTRRRFKSKDYEAWEKAAEAWAVMHAEAILKTRAFLQVKQNEVIRVEATFWFPREKLVTKKGKPKKLDVSNRVKALHDKLAAVLGVDDSLFWETQERKVVIGGRVMDPSYSWVDVHLSVIDLPG